MEQVPALAGSLNHLHVTPSLWLDKAEEDIGHTIVNWLYTGSYQMLHDPTAQGTAKIEKEYRRSVEMCLSHLWNEGLSIPGLGLYEKVR